MSKLSPEDKAKVEKALRKLEVLELDAMLLKAEAAAGMQDGFPIISALVDKENETLILE